MLPSRLRSSRVLASNRQNVQRALLNPVLRSSTSNRWIGTHSQEGPLALAHRPSCPGPSKMGTPVRGKRTKTVMDLADLPQGVLHRDPLPDVQTMEPSSPAYPTVMLQVRRNMQKFDNCVIVTRVGGFYELYFEHAEELGPLLNLKVAQRKTAAGPVAMVSEPALDRDCLYLPLLCSPCA